MNKFHLQNCLWFPIKKNQIFCTKMTTSEKFQLSYNSKPLKKFYYTPFTCSLTVELPMIFYKHRLVEKTLSPKWLLLKFPISHVQKFKKIFVDSPLSFAITVEH